MTVSPPTGHDSRTFAIIGAAMEVHRTLGSGFLEAVYREALGIEFSLRGIPFTREVPCSVTYKDHLLGGHYRVDFVCFDEVLVEIKARAGIGMGDQAQVINYLASTGQTLALLLNFGSQRLEHRRLILTRHWPGHQP